MTDDSTTESTPTRAQDAPSAPKRSKGDKGAPELPDHLRGASGDGVTDARDFLDLSDATAVADAIGGEVEHIGVAFHVNDPA